MDEVKKNDALTTVNQLLTQQSEGNEKRVTALEIANTSLINAEEKTNKIKKLYAFISQVNQQIVRIEDEASLFKNACRLALEFGKFKMAWIGLFNNAHKQINLIEHCGVDEADVTMLTNAPYAANGPQEMVLRSGELYICNNISINTSLAHWLPFAQKHGIESFMILPIKKGGNVIGTLNLYATESDFSEKEEVALLVEVAGDISFALDLFEKSKNQKSTEQQLVLSEKQLEFDRNNLYALINNTTDLMWSVATNFTLITSNQPFNSMVKLLTGKTIAKGSNGLNVGFTAEQMAYYKKSYTRAFAGEKFTEIRQISIPNKNWAEISYHPIVKGNTIIGAACHLHNITERKLAEQKLQKSEAFNKGVLNSLSSHIAVINATGSIVAINTAWKKFARENGETTLQHTGEGSNYLEVCRKSANLGDKIAAEVLQGITNVLNESSPSFYLEYPCHSPEQQRWFAVRVLKFESNEPMAVIIHQDISDRKLAETERTIIINDLVQRNKEQEQFTYIVSHNLRAPVANIIGITDAFKTMELDANEKEQLTEHLEIAAKKLDEVIKDLNAILQLKSALNEQKERVQFSELLTNIQVSIESLINSENVVFVTNFSELDEMDTLKSYLYSIFYNLISNSIKYRLPDVNPIITISSKKIGNKTVLFFKDNGLGIDLQKQRDQVFGLYKRFHSHTEGKGMGLYMVKAQVETLGGRIFIESEVNKGTAFRIEFSNQ